jgi:peptidoglycan-associated lipoprotein
MTKRTPLLGLAAAVVATLAGCASTSDVDKRISAAQSKADKKLEAVEGQVEELQARQKVTEGKVDDQGKSIDQHAKLIAEVGQSAADAVKRAQEAGVLAKGKVVFQQTFSEDRVRFQLNSYDLSKEAKAALDEFAAKVKVLDMGYYIEIQGHTDSSGSPKGNDMLGQMRAEASRQYLARQHKLPLPRLSTISYGDTLPVESNKTKAGRGKNRRVVMVVLE